MVTVSACALPPAGISSTAENSLCEYATFTITVAVIAPSDWFRLWDRTFALPTLLTLTLPLPVICRLCGRMFARETARP